MYLDIWIWMLLNQMLLHSCVSLTSRIMNSLASREAMLSRLPMEERVLSRKWARVLRGLSPPLSWYLSTLSFSNDHSGRALSHLCPLYPGWQSQLKEPHSPRHFPWTPQEGPPAVRHTPSVRTHPGVLFSLSAALLRSYTWQKTDTHTERPESAQSCTSLIRIDSLSESGSGKPLFRPNKRS